MNQLLEYRLKVSLRVGTYKSHLEMQEFASRLSEVMGNYCKCNSDVVCDGIPTVDVIYEPPKPE